MLDKFKVNYYTQINYLRIKNIISSHYIMRIMFLLYMRMLLLLMLRFECHIFIFSFKFRISNGVNSTEFIQQKEN